MSVQLYNSEQEVAEYYKLMLKTKKAFFMQRTKETWLRQGDRCTYFLFASLTSRQHANSITYLKN